MSDGKTQVRYGYITVKGKRCGFATYKVRDKEVILISIPYGGLIKFVNGQRATVLPEDVMLWAKIAGWLGFDELHKELFGGS